MALQYSVFFQQNLNGSIQNRGDELDRATSSGCFYEEIQAPGRSIMGTWTKPE
jgi:hypothetical protein